MIGWRVVEAHQGRLIGHVMYSDGPDRDGHQLAACSTGHQPPAVDCRCGIHFVTDPTILRGHIASDDLWERRVVILAGHPTGRTLPDAVTPEWTDHGVTSSSWRASGFQAVTAYASHDNPGAPRAAHHHGLALLPLIHLEAS